MSDNQNQNQNSSQGSSHERAKDHAGLWLAIICGLLALLVIVMNVSF